MPNLVRLPPFNDDGELLVVVEAPRGCGLKLKYDEDQHFFTATKALPRGLAYPYDWGFIPGTVGEDGDPLDVLILNEVPSYPGVVFPSRLLGVLELTERAKSGKRRRNDRLIALPLVNEAFVEAKDARQLPKRLRLEIELFFLNTTFFAQKDPQLAGWKGPQHALELVREAEKRAKKS